MYRSLVVAQLETIDLAEEAAVVLVVLQGAAPGIVPGSAGMRIAEVAEEIATGS